MASSEYDYFSWRILQIQIFDYLLNILNGFNEGMKVLWLLVNNNYYYYNYIVLLCQ